MKRGARGSTSAFCAGRAGLSSTYTSPAVGPFPFAQLTIYALGGKYFGKYKRFIFHIFGRHVVAYDRSHEGVKSRDGDEARRGDISLS